jgi:hypothetical protein
MNKERKEKRERERTLHNASSLLNVGGNSVIFARGQGMSESSAFVPQHEIYIDALFQMLIMYIAHIRTTQRMLCIFCV